MVSRESEGARIVSVDVGSSSVRAELYDDSGNGIDGTEVKLDYEFEYTPDGGAEKDADELLDLVVRAVDGTLSEAGGTAISPSLFTITEISEESAPILGMRTCVGRRPSKGLLTGGASVDAVASDAGGGAVSEELHSAPARADAGTDVPVSRRRRRGARCARP